MKYLDGGIGYLAQRNFIINITTVLVIIFT